MCAACQIDIPNVFETYNAVSKPKDDDGSFALARRCLMIILTKDNHETLPLPYEGIYAACRSIVTVSNNGEGLYGTLKMELEKSVGRLASDLTRTAETGMNWIVEFVKVCKWFELHIVRVILESRNAANSSSTVLASITHDLFGSSIRCERP